MPYNELVEKLRQELNARNTEIGQLTIDLADASSRSTGRATSNAIVSKLQHKIELHVKKSQDADARAVTAEITTQNTLERMAQVDRDLVRCQDRVKTLEHERLDTEQAVEVARREAQEQTLSGEEVLRLKQKTEMLEQCNANLFRQLVAAVEELRTLQGVSGSGKGHDDPIDELVLSLPGHRKLLTSIYRPRRSKPGPTSKSKSASSHKSKPAPSRKRARPSEQLEDELRDLNLDTIEHPTERRRVRQRSNLHTSDTGAREPFNFKFTAVITWKADGSVDEFRKSSEFKIDLPLSYVQDRIRAALAWWEKTYGHAWFWAAKDDFKAGKVRCVSRLRDDRRDTRWRLGQEGKFACADCVVAGRPCFVYIQGGLAMLPLHADDRSGAVTKRKPIGIWVREEIKFEEPESDDDDDDEDDDE